MIVSTLIILFKNKGDIILYHIPTNFKPFHPKTNKNRKIISNLCRNISKILNNDQIFNKSLTYVYFEMLINNIIHGYLLNLSKTFILLLLFLFAYEIYELF